MTFLSFVSALAAAASITVQSPETVDTDAFDQFRQSFKIAALAEGISAATYDREMASVAPLKIVLERNNNQPEFSRPVWKYLESAVSSTRVTDGRNYSALHQSPLNAAAEKYGVDAPIIAAVWGLESSYGRIQGDYDILSALTTLAYQGRRQKFGRQQLLGALTIIDEGYATRAQLKGSWAGAMGQTQFIPTTYLTYAVDENADGRRDLWADHEDVFASTANYLKRSGYELGRPWGVEVKLPDGFDYSQADRSVRRTVADWMMDGVTAPTGSLGNQVDLNERSSIILPAGASGPAFMVFDNFRAILKYNNSTAYALGIGMLSNALAGEPMTLSANWPVNDRPLSRTERKALQQALADKGYNPGPVDGIVGAGTKRALRAWQLANNLPADGYASAVILEKLLAS